MADPNSTIIHHNLDTDAKNAGVEVITALAEIEGKDATDLPKLYGCTDDILDNLFSTPPSPESQMEITFSYQGYRITIQQNGRTKFVKPD